MKTLIDYCKKNDLKLLKIRYKHQFGYMKRKGFDICDPSGFIYISFEPVNYSNGEKWFVRHSHNNFQGQKYLKRISKKYLENNIKLNEKSFFRNNTINL